MKQCPKCQRTYTDETMVFCLEDGKVLNEMFTPPAPTQYIPAAKLTNEEVATVVARKGEIPSVAVNYEPTQISPGKNWMIFAVVGLFAVFALGGIGLIVVFKNEIFGGTSRPVFTSNNNSNSNSENQTTRNTGIWSSENDNSTAPSPTPVNPSNKLLGRWHTSPKDNDYEEEIAVKLDSDKTFSQIYHDKFGNRDMLTGKWRLSDNILYETYASGETFTGSLEFIDADTVEVTTIDKKNPQNNGKKLLYRRVKP